MQEILEVLKNGTRKEQLSIVADIVTILGVSLATVLGGAFVFNAKNNLDSIVGVLTVVIFSVVGTCITVAAFMVTSAWLGQKLQGDPFICRLLQIALWLMFGLIFIYAAFLAYTLLSSIRFV